MSDDRSYLSDGLWRCRTFLMRASHDFVLREIFGAALAADVLGAFSDEVAFRAVDFRFRLVTVEASDDSVKRRMFSAAFSTDQLATVAQELVHRITARRYFFTNALRRL